MHGRPASAPLFRTLLLLFIAVIVVMEFPAARDLVRVPYSGIETQNLLVRRDAPLGPNGAADILPGDIVTAVDGTRVRNYNHLRHIVAENTTFSPQEYTLLRNDVPVVTSVSYTRIPTATIYRRFAFLLVGFTFLGVALLVIVRRSDPVGILFAANCAMIAFLLTDRPVYPSGALQLGSELLHDAVILFFPAVFLHFFMVFHDRPLGKSRRRLKRRATAVYALPVVLFTTSAVVATRQFMFAPTEPLIVQALLAGSTLYMVGYVVASLVVFIRNYRRSAAAQKQKLRIAITGTTAGILPFLVMVVWRQFAPGQQTILEWVSVAMLSLVSVSFAYAILKHGAIQLDIVVRKGIGYAFLSGATIAVYYGFVVLLGSYLRDEFHLDTPVFSMVTILVLAVIFAPARELVQRGVDRAFSRDTYDFEREVIDFNQQLTRRLTREELLDCFCSRTKTLLRPSFVAFYIANGSESRWDCTRAEGLTPSLPNEFPVTSVLGRFITRYRRPILVEFLDHSWGRRDLDERSRVFIERSRAAVCIPIPCSDGLWGLAVLGSKASGRLYTPKDGELLSRCAEHLGLVLENAELHQVSMEKERLQNEVMLARDIQLGLLPDAPPIHDAIRVQGRMESSDEVGGDFFDYFLLSRDRIGVCIGDVNGHGVPAAMLMSSIQAVFRNLAMRDRMPPAELLRELNRYLCRSGSPGQFATFFYGIIDSAASTFTFCNAGHCPALLVRESYVDRLGDGGMPLGVLDSAEYKEGSARISPGELLCLYTDGITEQPDSQDDEYGEERLIDFLRLHDVQPLDAWHDELFASLRAFGHGRIRDDATCLIVHYETA